MRLECYFRFEEKLIMAKRKNSKSDNEAVAWYSDLLKDDGYQIEKIGNSEADIIAKKDNEQFFFEIKMTKAKVTYFGAATLTEWTKALEHPDNYLFVIIKEENGDFEVVEEFTPRDFMEYSSIPPFKVNFHIKLEKGKRKPPVRRTAIQFTEQLSIQLRSMYDRLTLDRNNKK